MNIFVMRHARSVVNENKSLYDTYRDEDAPLSENGIKYFHEQVESIINKIEKSMGVYNYINVYCSPYKRTLDTYELLKPYFEKSSFTINHFEINPLLIEHIGYYFYNSEDFPLYVEGLRKYGSKFYYKYNRNFE